MTAEEALGAMRRRAYRTRSRARVRRWEYRQRDLAKGVWNRLARLLAHAREVWGISEAAAQELRAEGRAPDPAGGEIHPPKEVFLVSAERLAAIPGRRPIPPRMGPEFLAARHIVIVPFSPAQGQRGVSSRTR